VLQITHLPKSAEIAHWKLFEHYVRKEQFAELVKLPSPFLERFVAAITYVSFLSMLHR
jgi:hypothetical protein